MTAEHPFAQYVRTLGRGKKASRALTGEEAYRAMRMVFAEEVEPVQLGAFLMLTRVKEETPEELSAFVRAAREFIAIPANTPEVDLDWSSYAGKRRHLPWFILSALLLAEQGIRVFMHGMGGRQDGRLYTPEIMATLGIHACHSLDEAAAQLQTRHFAFITLEQFCPKLRKLIDLRDLLGLRSPAHSMARMLNPLRAPAMMQGVFHPGYRDIHQQAALLLGQPRIAVFRGEGGEIERNPDRPCLVASVQDGALVEEEWPARFSSGHFKDETLDPQCLLQLWRGEIDDEYATASVTGTAAIALKLLGKADSREAAEALATTLWNDRIKSSLDVIR